VKHTDCLIARAYCSEYIVSGGKKTLEGHYVSERIFFVPIYTTKMNNIPIGTCRRFSAARRCAYINVWIHRKWRYRTFRLCVVSIYLRGVKYIVGTRHYILNTMFETLTWCQRNRVPCTLYLSAIMTYSCVRRLARAHTECITHTIRTDSKKCVLTRVKYRTYYPRKRSII